MDTTKFTVDDAALALLQGKEVGLDFFFHRYYGRLLWLCSRIAGTTADHSTVVEDVFVDLWGERDSLPPRSIPEWLYQRTVQRCLRRLSESTGNVQPPPPPEQLDRLISAAELYGRIQLHHKNGTAPLQTIRN